MPKIGRSRLSDLVRAHHRNLVRFVSGIVGSVETAEDIAHDVYLKCSGQEGEVGGVNQPKAYLFAAARNAALDYLERQRVEWSHRERGEGMEEVPSPEPTLDARVDGRQRLERMAAALNELPAACRLAFVLNKLQGMEHRAIAQRMGISVSMVEKHVVRALMHCRDRLRETQGIEDSVP